MAEVIDYTGIKYPSHVSFIMKGEYRPMEVIKPNRVTQSYTQNLVAD